MEYIDVDSLSDLPILGMGQRYFDTIGGDKAYRCFIISEKPENNSSSAENKTVANSGIEPIFENKGIVIYQDTTYPLPGFYRIAPAKDYKSFDEIDPITYQRLMYIIYNIKKLTRIELTTYHIHVIYEEKVNLSYSLHLLLLPMANAKKINELDINSYLKFFSVADNYHKSIELNKTLRELITKWELYKKDNAFSDLLNNNLQ
ncbi:hypothetical protein [uncultured Sphaerochaeta sp.]|uniref:hypothetical protein n=1 Tax=uncultured Sphaerochaeta sp. TaxID=886478 RepID=UPI002A0A9F41|nr:hypothetical protein [uncultured Sphaerochaeta sp.]